ncbi:hypothetical protein FRB96_003565 [Tulasnella sp. 330]|nr:hypothetical protein FRB96_003565 [Tulasnella sp. 330]
MTLLEKPHPLLRPTEAHGAVQLPELLLLYFEKLSKSELAATALELEKPLLINLELWTRLAEDYFFKVTKLELDMSFGPSQKALEDIMPLARMYNVHMCPNATSLRICMERQRTGMAAALYIFPGNLTEITLDRHYDDEKLEFIAQELATTYPDITRVTLGREWYRGDGARPYLNCSLFSQLTVLHVPSLSMLGWHTLGGCPHLAEVYFTLPCPGHDSWVPDETPEMSTSLPSLQILDAASAFTSNRILIETTIPRLRRLAVYLEEGELEDGVLMACLLERSPLLQELEFFRPELLLGARTIEAWSSLRELRILRLRETINSVSCTDEVLGNLARSLEHLQILSITMAEKAHAESEHHLKFFTIKTLHTLVQSSATLEQLELPLDFSVNQSLPHLSTIRRPQAPLKQLSLHEPIPPPQVRKWVRLLPFIAACCPMVPELVIARKTPRKADAKWVGMYREYMEGSSTRRKKHGRL